MSEDCTGVALLLQLLWARVSVRSAGQAPVEERLREGEREKDGSAAAATAAAEAFLIQDVRLPRSEAPGPGKFVT